MALSSMKTVFPWNLNCKWFMLQRNTDRLDSREQAEAGSIFQIDLTDTNVKGSGKYGTNIVMENIEHVRQKVFWEAGLFIALDDDVKALLQAVNDPKERLHIYTAQKDLLTYAKGLKVGDHVCVTLPKSRRETLGKVKYIGPVESRGPSTGQYFGIELSEHPLDETVLKKNDIFSCIQNRGIIIPMNFLVAHTKTCQPKTSLDRSSKFPSGTNAEQKDDSAGVEKDLPKPPMVNEGDFVMAYTKMQSGHGKCSWVMGKVLLLRDGKVAVEVDKAYGTVMNSWNGFFKHEMLLQSPPRQTVLVQLKDVKTLDQYGQIPPKARKEKNVSMQKSYAGAVKEGKSQPVLPRRDDSLKQLPSTIESTCTEMQANVMKANNLSEEHCLDEFASAKESMSFSHSPSSSDERVLSLQDGCKVKHPGTAVRRSSSLKESKQNSLHPTKEGKQSGGKDSSSGNFFSLVKNAFSGKRLDPPKLPFRFIHFQTLCEEKEVWTKLMDELQMTKRWNNMCSKQDASYVIVEKFLKEWWDSFHEGHSAELKKFTDCLRTNKLHDLADNIQQVPENAAFDASVLELLALTANEKWDKLASNFPIQQHELTGKLKQSYSSHTNLHLVFEIWQQKDAGCLKIWKLINACRETGMQDVAADIEQGLSESYCRALSRQIERTQWKKFGENLSLSRIRLDAFGVKFHDMADRVFHVLSYWSMTSPLDTDKIGVLAQALRHCNLDNIANELQRDLSEEELQMTAALVDTNWTRLALHFSQYEVDNIRQKPQTPVEKATLVLKIWRGRQPLENKELKKTLYTFLLERNFCIAARQLYDGLDSETVVELANKLCFEWTLLAKHFGYEVGEISRRVGSTDQLDMSFIMLEEWLNANKGNHIKETKDKLYKGLKAIGRDDLVEWLEGRLSDIADEETSKNYDTKPKQANRAPKSAKFDRILMEKIEKAVPDAKGSGFMDLLNMSHESVQAHMPQSVKYENNPVVAVLSAWKKKMNQEGHGDMDIIRKLKNLFQLYGMMNAVVVLPDLPPEGSSVDMENTREQLQGAVGGESVPEFNVNSMVEVDWDGKARPGVIQWIGNVKGLESHGEIAGIELEEGIIVGGTNGWFCNEKYFECEGGRGLFLPLKRCRPDSRFLSETETNRKKIRTTEEDFGGVKCEPVEGHEKPPEKVMQESIGMFKGIQGDHNSCYMDVTLYSMFAFNSVFDAILHCDESTKAEVRDVKDALRRTIVNPLRRHGFVRADYVLHFRELLNCLSSMEGLRTEEKDPEEFIHALLQELLNAKPFLAISQGIKNTMESFVYQIFLDKKDYLDIPTVQDLLHVSFLESDLKLTEVPECLIVQLPRYGKKYKLFDWIIPSLEMDICLLIRDTPRPCSYCGVLAFTECRDCTPKPGADEIIQSFCKKCFELKHDTTNKRHQTNSLVVPKDFRYHYELIKKECTSLKEVAEKTQHLYEEKCMELFSVVCIETSHYVAFVKAGTEDKAEWVFFDSMADRIGDQHGYNVPEVTHLKKFAEDMEREDLKDTLKRSANLSKYLRRLLSDAYICFYRPVKSKKSSPRGKRMSTTVPKDQDVSSRSPESKSNDNQQSNYSQLQDNHPNNYANFTPRYPPSHHHSSPTTPYFEKNEYARQQKRDKMAHQEIPTRSSQNEHHRDAQLGYPGKIFGTNLSSEHSTGSATVSWQYSSNSQFYYKPSLLHREMLRPADFETYQNSSQSVKGTYASHQQREEEDMDLDLYSGDTEEFKEGHSCQNYSSFQEGNSSNDNLSDTFEKLDIPDNSFESRV